MFIQALVLLTLAGLLQGATPLWRWSHEPHAKDIHAVLKDSFDYSDTQGNFGLGDSLTIAPSPKNDGTFVMRFFHKKDSYAGSCRGHGCQRGAQFYAQPSGVSGHTTLTLEYEVCLWVNMC